MSNFEITLYNSFGISERKEKSLFLSNEERIEVLNSLKKGEITDLVKWVIMPFPKFVIEYLDRSQELLKKRKAHYKPLDQYIMGETYKNSDIAYKMYMLSEAQIKTIINYISNPDVSISSLISSNAKYCIEPIIRRFETPLEKSYIVDSECIISRDYLRKCIHIMSYIDAHEAERLGLTSFTFYTQGKYRGFDIENKLKSVNPLIRHILICYLGLNGSYYSLEDLKRELSVTNSALDDLLNIDFLLNFSRSCGEFRNHIKYLDREYAPNERIEYAFTSSLTPGAKSAYSKIAETIELQYLKHHIEDNNITSPKINKKVREYLLKNYASNFHEILDERGLSYTM